MCILRQTQTANAILNPQADSKSQTITPAPSQLSLGSATNKLSIDLSNYPALARVSAAIADLVTSSPTTLDTLSELAAALGKGS